MILYAAMVWILYYLLLTCTYLAEAQYGVPCDEMMDSYRVDPDDCAVIWMCTTVLDYESIWVSEVCPAGYRADEKRGCVRGGCSAGETAPADTFDCAAAGPAYGKRVYPDPLNCNYYWYCSVINGKVVATRYRCANNFMFKQSLGSCWNGPCER